MKKRAISFFVAFTMILSLLFDYASALTILDSGFCGENNTNLCLNHLYMD